MKRHVKAHASSNGSPVAPSSRRHAKRAALRYVSDEMPGIRRLPKGKGFRYVSPSGRPLRGNTLKRLRSLVIPPAWTDVWICPSSRGHLQATGRDARGRKQYLYHPKWSLVRNAAKYDRLAAFGKLLPRIRRAVKRDMARPGLPKEKIIATLIQLLEKSLIRVGNEEYARTNGSFGLTTLRDRHAAVKRGSITFTFRGKSGKKHCVDVDGSRLTHIVRQCQELPGDELFQYLDETGRRHSIGSADVNTYLRDISGEDITAKDFRTWAGTCLAAESLLQRGKSSTETEAKRAVNDTIRDVADRLGNTVAICRKCYIHPAIVKGYMDGSLLAGKFGKELKRAITDRSGKRNKEKLLIHIFSKL